MILVLGNAAHADLIVTVDTVPSAHDVGRVTGGPGAAGQWLPGGSAATVAIAAAQSGAHVRLWHPLPPDASAGIRDLSRAGIDLTVAPRTGGTVRALIAQVDSGGRLCWSADAADPGSVDVDAALDGVTLVAVCPRWGAWSEQVMDAARQRNIPAALIGEASAGAKPYDWAHLIVDRRQHQDSDLSAAVVVVTRGEQGAEIITAAGENTATIPAVPVCAVDTSGAGDTFAGAYLARIMTGDDPRAAGAHAAQHAAQTCLQWGARPPAFIPPPIGSPLSRARGALLGVACGDAFGMPNSFLQEPVWRSGMEPGPANSPYHAGYPAGRITDDTEQAMALTESLQRSGAHLDAHEAADDLMAWFQRVGGEHSLAVGPSTKRAMIALRNGVPLNEVGTSGVTNGAPMRIAPVGVWGALSGMDPAAVVDEVATACLPTHNTSVAISGAAAIALGVWAGVNGQSWDEAVDAGCRGADLGAGYGKWVYAPNVARRIRWACDLMAQATTNAAAIDLISELIGTGEPVTESVPAAFAVATYADGDPALAILIAGNLRGDTDTVGAMAGALCGAQRGSDAFPPDWEPLIRTVNNVNFDTWVTALADHHA